MNFVMEYKLLKVKHLIDIQDNTIDKRGSRKREYNTKNCIKKKWKIKIVKRLDYFIINIPTYKAIRLILNRITLAFLKKDMKNQN